MPKQVELSKDAKQLLAKVSDANNWFKAYDDKMSAKRKAAMQELVDAGLVGMGGRVVSMILCYVPRGMKPLKQEQYPNARKMMHIDRMYDTDANGYSRHMLMEMATLAQNDARYDSESAAYYLENSKTKQRPAIERRNLEFWRDAQNGSASNSAIARKYLFALIDKGVR